MDRKKSKDKKLVASNSFEEKEKIMREKRPEMTDLELVKKKLEISGYSSI